MADLIQDKTIAGYRLDEKLSDNEYSESWIAEAVSDGRKYFLKSYRPDAGGSPVNLKRILERSFTLQKRLKARGFLSCLKRASAGDSLLHVYPYRSLREYHRFGYDDFRQTFPASLVQICLLLDLLHCKGLVHCDIKFENFLTSTTDGDIILSDFEFLANANDKPLGNIIGTPGYIAPEIRDNSEILRQSDNYSFGVGLRNFLAENGGCPEIERAARALGEMAGDLTAEDPAVRPLFLGQVLFKHGIISAEEYGDYLRRLLGRYLISNYAEKKRELRSGELGLNSFLRNFSGVYGIPEEFIEDISKLPALRIRTILRKLPAVSKIERFGDFWHISVADEYLYEQYKALGILSEFTPVKIDIGEYDTYGKLTNLDKEANQIRSSGAAFKNYLKLQAERPQSGKLSYDNNKTEISRLILLALISDRLGRITNAVGILEELVQAEGKPIYLEQWLKLRLAFRYAQKGRYDEFREIVEQAISEDPDHNYSYNELMRLKAWRLRIEGKFGESGEILKNLKGRLEKSDRFDDLTRVTYDLAIVRRIEGDTREAIRLFKEVLKLEEKCGNVNNQILALEGISVIAFCKAEYREALRYEEQALALASRLGGVSNLLSVYSRLMNIYTRMGNYRKAEYCLQKSNESISNDTSTYRFHYMDKGFLLLNSGMYSKAELALKTAESLLTVEKSPKELSKIYQMLAVAAFYRGDIGGVKGYSSKSREACVNFGDLTEIHELDLLESLSEYFSGKSDNGGQILGVLDELIERKSYFYAAQALFYVIVEGLNPSGKLSVTQRGFVSKIIKQQEVPLFKAISHLIDTSARPIRLKENEFAGMKKAYRALENGCQYFQSAMLSLKIAELYIDQGNPKLGGKFLDNAEKTFRRFGNEHFIGLIEQLKNRLSQTSGDRKHLADSILKISEVFGKIDNYSDAVERMVRYVVEETGAERGVLVLLDKENPNEPSIEASFNCDEDSIEDISKISSNIPQAVFRKNEPLIIEDALENKMTSGFKSIIRHNIRSVICIPLKVNAMVNGVLYLDHQTIPALFDKEDVAFSMATANFLSTLLKTLKKYKTLGVFKKVIQDQHGRRSFVTRNKTMNDLLKNIPRIAISDSDVLITGESGTGKQLIAEMIHYESLRKDHPLIAFNCAAISETLIESELFGVTEGAYTGAKARDGKFAAADGGTLFVDEIGNMSLAMQKKILVAIETKTFSKVGSNLKIYSDARIIYATNKDLKGLVEADEFQSDLYYRINKIRLHLPPLRERKDDIKLLANHFLKGIKPEFDTPFLTDDIYELLERYHWPGNVRELYNAIERLIVLFPGKVILKKDLPAEIVDAKSSGNYKSKSDRELKRNLENALIRNDWNQSAASRDLGMPPATFRRKMKKFGLGEK